MNDTNEFNNKVPIWHKIYITVKEAASYSNIGRDKILKLMERPDCNFTLCVGDRKTLINRRKFEEFLDKQFII